MPSNSLYKRTLSKNEQVPVGILTGRKHSKRFAKILASLLKRKDISPAAKLVLLGYDMESYGADVIGISDGAIGDAVGIARTTVLFARQELVRLGLIEEDGTPIKQVQPYRLAYRTPAEAAKNTLMACAKCARRCKQLGKVGWCRSCVVDGTRECLWMAAKATLGPTATFDEICAYLHVDRIRKPWARIARKLERIA